MTSLLRLRPKNMAHSFRRAGPLSIAGSRIDPSRPTSVGPDSRADFRGGWPSTSLPSRVHHLSVMLSSGVVGFLEPTATQLRYWLPGDERVSPEQGRRAIPEIGASFERIRGRFKKDECRRPGTP